MVIVKRYVQISLNISTVGQIFCQDVKPHTNVETVLIYIDPTELHLDVMLQLTVRVQTQTFTAVSTVYIARMLF